jgi:hypothetical protein
MYEIMESRKQSPMGGGAHSSIHPCAQQGILTQGGGLAGGIAATNQMMAGVQNGSKNLDTRGMHQVGQAHIVGASGKAGNTQILGSMVRRVMATLLC